MNIFEPQLVRAHRTRAAAGLDQHDFLFREVAERLADRLSDTTRTFPLALDLGCHGGEFGEIVGDDSAADAAHLIDRGWQRALPGHHERRVHLTQDERQRRPRHLKYPMSRLR